MKNHLKFSATILLLSSLLILNACMPAVLRHTSTEGLSYQGTDIYYQNELCARMTALEIAYDHGKIVRECTFVIVDGNLMPTPWALSS